MTKKLIKTFIWICVFLPLFLAQAAETQSITTKTNTQSTQISKPLQLAWYRYGYCDYHRYHPVVYYRRHWSHCYTWRTCHCGYCHRIRHRGYCHRVYHHRIRHLGYCHRARRCD